MTTEKLPNGHYRVRQQSNGKRYSVTFDHKPTQKEIVQALADKMGQYSPNSALEGSVGKYALLYLIKCEKDDKSPSTIRGYRSIYRNTPEWFLSLNFNIVNSVQVQTMLDEYFEGHSPKSVRLLWSFYRSIFDEYRRDNIPTIKLPQIEKQALYEPSTDDIKRIIKLSEGTRYHIPLQLAILGLRRGEVCALNLSDLDDNNVLTINKALVVDEYNKIQIKDSPKTVASNRRILIPGPLADEIRERGYIFEGNPHTINEALHRYQDRLGIPRFKLHMLRHFAAAYLHQQGFTDSQILAYGGWEEGSEVMKSVYRYNLDPEKAQSEIANKFSNLI